MITHTIPFKSIKALSVTAVALVPLAVLAQPISAAQNQGNQYNVVTTITGPNIPPTGTNSGTVNPGQWCVDISYYDASNDRYYLADANNRQVDVVNAHTNQLLAPIGAGDFTGVGGCKDFDFARFGPAGIVTDNMNQLWVGNGDSIVHVYNKNTGTPIATVDTHGVNRADELAYDPQDKLIVVTNPNETTPFVTFIAADTHQVVGQIQFPNVPQDSLEQPQYNAATHRYYMSVRTSAQNVGGEVDVLDPSTKSVATVYGLTGCGPSGLSINSAARQFAVGCDIGNPAQILRISDGRILKKIPQITGVDEVWFNPGDQKYYFGSFGIPALGIVDATDNSFEQNIPSTDPGFHAAAVSSKNNEVFMPQAGKGIVVLKSEDDNQQ